jgi:serine/threonine protein kinase
MGMGGRRFAYALAALVRKREPIRPRSAELPSIRTASAAASAPAVVGEPVAAMLGRYRVEREIGAGAMGVVHVAFDVDLQRWVALKVLRSALVTPGAADRLLREARAMARLSHPNVVAVYEVASAGDRGFVAMELIRGGTLEDWLTANNRPLVQILDAFLAAGRGLAAAHAAGIVHRDFKPRNVLRDHNGRIALGDFGLARELHDALDATDSLAATLRAPGARVGHTTTGSLLGTPAYMAPEQWCGGAITPATDQFAYCVALWEAIAGQRPYRGSSAESLRAQIARGPVAIDARHIPHRMRDPLCCGLDPDPARRWPSMTALLDQLSRARRRRGIVLDGARSALVATTALLDPRPRGDAPGPSGAAGPGSEMGAITHPQLASAETDRGPSVPQPQVITPTMRLRKIAAAVPPQASVHHPPTSDPAVPARRDSRSS